MSGFTKNMFQNEMQEVYYNFSDYIKQISNILPIKYEFEDILDLVIKYYPYEWRCLNEMYEEYTRADKRLVSFGKKKRYMMSNPKNIIKNLKITKELLSTNKKTEYEKQFSSEIYESELEKIESIRLPKIHRIDAKINDAKSKVQLMEPVYFKALMGFYDRKRTTQKDKVYIMHELTKYYSKDIVKFFKKTAHSEYNFQLREMAFKYLQQFYHYTTLRKQKYMQIHSKNKKKREKMKKYAKERYDLKAIPEELEYRIKNSKEQKLKRFDYFISHSSIDHNYVQKLIQHLNSNNKNVYCDWKNDSDYLKRNLVQEATKSVIKARLEESDKLIIVESDAALKSVWVKYEINYFLRLKKPIFLLTVDDISNDVYELHLVDYEYDLYCDDYDNLTLF